MMGFCPFTHPRGVKGGIISPFNCPFCLAFALRLLRARQIDKLLLFASSRSNRQKKEVLPWVA